MADRETWLTQTDDALLRDCAVDTYRASGPGGQKRNKTSSAVRLRHGPSGLMVIAEESRSQHENKAKAVKRLRLTIALACRQPMPEDGSLPAVFSAHRSADGRIDISRRHEDYPRFVAVVLDALAAVGGRLKDAATALGTTTGQLSGVIVADGKVLDQVNRIRAEHGQSPIRAG